MSSRTVARLLMVAGLSLLSVFLCWIQFGTAAPARSTLPARAALIAQLPGRQTEAGRGAIVRVEVVYENGTTVVLSGDSLVTPSPSPTGTPSNTPTATPPIAATWTPTATFTPPPTNTPHATATAYIEPTPTPEATILPTLPATTTPKTCSLRAVTNIRVRSGPSTEYGHVDNWPTGAEKIFDRFQYDTTEAYLWGRHDSGWSAVFWQYDAPRVYQGEWLIAGGEGVEVCRDVEGWPWNLYPPEPVAFRTRGGFHALNGEGVNVLLEPGVVCEYEVLKCLDGGFGLCEDVKRRCGDTVTIIYRSYQTDKPPEWAFENVEAWWRYIEKYLPPGADYYEVMNEHDPPVERAEAWTNAMIQMAQIVARERGVPLLGYSNGPGHPDIPLWKYIVPYIEFCKSPAGVAPNGERCGMSTHSSGMVPESVKFSLPSWLNELWVANREAVFCEFIRVNFGVTCDGLPWYNTELGITDGYQGSQEQFSCEDKALAYQETIRRKSEAGIVDGFCWWNVGKIGAWSSDHACVRRMVTIPVSVRW